jgi:RHS repeat-associated protein
MRRNGVLTYLHGDHLGSTSLVTNDAGGFVARVLYYPYGEERYVEGTLTTDYGFTGQRRDSYTQLIQMGDRWYDAQLGRWISADTIVPEPGNPQSLNRFSYVDNNPLKYIDPSGHYKCIVYAPSGECLEWADDDLEVLKDNRDDVPQSSDRVGPLPSSYVQYAYCTASGKCWTGVGVAISSNTILTHDHVDQDVVRIRIEDPSSGATLSRINVGDFAYASPNDMGDAISLFVFRNDLFGDVATLGDADDLVGSNISAEVAVRRSMYAEQEGLYSTEVMEASDGWIHVSPDFTIGGDSGAPLFVNGKVYGINNRGTGKCGAVTDPERIYQLATSYTDMLRKPEIAGPPPGSRIR